MRPCPDFPTLLKRALAASLATVALTGPVPVTAQTPPMVPRFLTDSLRFTSAQVDAAERGAAIVVVLESSHPREVTIAGAVAVAVSREVAAARLRDFGQPLDMPTRSGWGRFSVPAAAADVESLRLDRDEVDELRECRPGACKFKLPATDMGRLRTDVDWTAKDPVPQVAAYARRRLVEYVNDYRTRGNAAMAVYDDRGSVHASAAFGDLLSNSPYLYQYAPSFHHYLEDYPAEPLPGVTEGVYWSRDETPGLRPIISVSHAAVYDPPEFPGATIAAAKQIYADHYFEAALELIVLVERTTADGQPGLWLLGLRRYRFDNLPGGIVNIRDKVRGRLRDAMRADLARWKREWEGATAR